MLANILRAPSFAARVRLFPYLMCIFAAAAAIACGADFEVASNFSSSTSVLTSPSTSTLDAAPMADDERLSELIRQEVSKMTWRKGDISITPYGVLWTDLIYASSRAFPGRFILWIESEEVEGESTLQIDGRYSRVGANIEGPKTEWLGGLSTGANVEVDFLGNFVVENRPDVRLRHAYAEAKSESMRFLAGQTWDLVSPLLPNTVNFSVGWGVGNLGFRRAQLRYERYIDLGDEWSWIVQGALAQNVIEDFANESPSDVQRETGNWPMIEGRTAVKIPWSDGDPTVIGISGHIGDTGFDFLSGHPANPSLGPENDVRFLTWSFNVDLTVPVTQRLGFRGEFFTGSNLSNYFGGIVQGVCPCLRVPIGSMGGWGEIWYEWDPDIRSHIGFGIDDPDNDDFVVGRSYNRFIYANTFIDLTERLSTGLEVSVWRTNYLNRSAEPGFTPIRAPTLPGEATVLDWTIRYAF